MKIVFALMFAAILSIGAGVWLKWSMDESLYCTKGSLKYMLMIPAPVKHLPVNVTNATYLSSAEDGAKPYSASLFFKTTQSCRNISLYYRRYFTSIGATPTKKAGIQLAVQLKDGSQFGLYCHRDSDNQKSVEIRYFYPNI